MQQVSIIKSNESQNIMEKSHERFYKIFLISPAAMGITRTKDNKLVEVNDRFLDLIEYSRAEVIGRTSHELKLWVNYKDRIKVIKQLHKDGRVNNYETKFKTKTGKIKDVIFSLQKIIFKGEENAVILFKFQDVSELKKAENALKVSQKILEEQKVILEQKNAALREMISFIELEKNIVKDQVVANIELLMPILQKIKMKGESQQHLFNLIKKGLGNLVSSFGKAITKESLKLTSREIEICNLIKSGLTSKEIAQIISITSQTVEKHRKNIRKKLKITDTSINLVTYLKSI